MRWMIVPFVLAASLSHAQAFSLCPAAVPQPLTLAAWHEAAFDSAPATP